MHIMLRETKSIRLKEKSNPGAITDKPMSLVPELDKLTTINFIPRKTRVKELL